MLLFIKPIRKIKTAVFVALFLAVTFPLFAENLAGQLKMIYNNAHTAIGKHDVAEADFWLARYMGLTAFNGKTNCGYFDLIPLFRKRKDLQSTSFISGYYDKEFLDFFTLGGAIFWGHSKESINRKDREFIVAKSLDKGYVAELTMSPHLEGWIIIKGSKPLQAVIPLGAEPYLLLAKLKDGKLSKHIISIRLDVKDRFVQYAWPIEFHDLDGDGVPEIWIRYNEAWADGFSQELAIYKIKDNKELVLLRKFDGVAEGIARRLTGSTVEVGYGFASKDGLGHLEYDRHHLETWEYQKGSFVKISEKDVPHILQKPSWTSYYFERKN